MKAVEFINVSKRFGSLPANDDVSFGIEKNTVHCILGENGAGKSTLMKMLFGIYKPDSGTIRINGEQVNFKSPQDAIEKKIGMVHQHFMLIDDFTVLENVILGNEITKGYSLDIKTTCGILNTLIKKYNLDLDLEKKISGISIGQQQKVEILKLLFRDSEILIFDEPTAVLSPIEVEKFFNIISGFKKSGKTIILITHKLNEVRQISDKVSVLRRGRLVYQQINDGNLSIDKLGAEIVGEVNVSESEVRRTVKDIGKPLLELEDICLKKNEVDILNKLNLELRTGEILGICGVEGNGQNELTDIVAGFEKEYTGTLIRRTENISIVPDDRIKKGMIKEFSVGENLILKRQTGSYITKQMLQEESEAAIKEFDVRMSDINDKMMQLSGGNQQKVIVAREILQNNDIIIFSHPTRGVDINATVFIHSKIIKERNSGKAVLLVSSDLDELISLSDRLCVLYNGRIVKTFESDIISSARESEKNLEIDLSLNKNLYDEIGKLMMGFTN